MSKEIFVPNLSYWWKEFSNLKTWDKKEDLPLNCGQCMTIFSKLNAYFCSLAVAKQKLPISLQNIVAMHRPDDKRPLLEYSNAPRFFSSSCCTEASTWLSLSTFTSLENKGSMLLRYCSTPQWQPLVGACCILKVQLTTIKVGSGFTSSHPAHHHWGWPWIRNFLLFPADRVLRLLVDIQIDRCADECWNTLPIPRKQNQEAYQLRYVFGYAMDGSDLPLHSLALPDNWTILLVHRCLERWLGSDGQMFVYGSVGDRTLLWCLLLWAAKALASSRMPSSGHSLLPGSKDTYLEQGQESKFSLTPRRIERKTPAAKPEGDQDMVAKGESVSDAESGWSGCFSWPGRWPVRHWPQTIP